MAKAPTTKLAIPSSKVEIALTPGSTAAAMKAVAATQGKLYFVPTGSIKEIPGFNVRVETPDYIAHRDMIAASIATNGYDETKPLSGYVGKDGDDNVLFITDGHTRLAAVNSLPDAEKPEKLPIIVRAAAPSLADLTAQLHTSNTGRPLSPFELGVVVKRLLKDETLDKAAVAKTLAVTPRYLDDVLLLVNSPKAVREAVLGGDVSSTMAIQELRKAGDAPEKAVERITSAVATAKAKGKTKATSKDTGPKMLKVKHAISIAAGTDMKEIVKAAAAHIRSVIAAVPHATDPEAKVADTDGSVTLHFEVPAPLTEKPAAKPKAAAVKKPAAKVASAKTPAIKAKAAEAAKEATDEAKAADAKPKPVRKKAAAKPAAAPVEEENITADDLGIEGAEEVEVTSEGEDDEQVILPPAVKNGEGVTSSDEESDI